MAASQQIQIVVLWFGSGEDTTSVLYGFTITGGKGGNPPEATHNAWGAGGIAIDAGAKIIYNKIVFNTVTSPHEYAYGGGILVVPTQPVQIIENIIANNRVIGKTEEEGGGGGIFCVYVDNSELIIADNIIANNSVISTLDAVKGSGGGINYTHSTANPKIRNNLIINNRAKIGGAFKFIDFVSDDENSTIINNTIVNNQASFTGGAIWTENPLTVVNSILWGNRAPNNPQIYGAVNVEYSNVEGGYSHGNGNIDQDPLFADTVNYYLTALSPCVDAGNPEGFFNDVEDPNNPGFPLFPALGGLRNDMGAYGGNSYMIYAQVPNYFIRNCSLNNTYQVPGTDTLIITSEIFSPDNQLVEVQAIIENYDGSISDTVLMFDDGTHKDSIAGDGFYTSLWVVPNGEEDYQIHISIYLSDYEYLVTLKNAANFTSKGLITLESMAITFGNEIPNPPERIKFSLTLRNDGITDTVYDVDVNIILPDNPLIVNSTTGIPLFGDISPGESLTNTSRDFALTFLDGCSSASYEFGIEITSNNIVYWYDTFTIDVVVGIEDGSSNLPKEFALEQNYPNPFNPTTKISFSIPKASFTKLIVYDLLGREIKVLVKEEKPAGNYEVAFNASGLSSGLYFYKLKTGNFVETKKMILLR